MWLKIHQDKILFYFVLGLFVWFFSSSLSIAYHEGLQHDDAMFATIPKNLLNGYGWATSYGEKIPFNPDISTGPTLLLPAAAMIAAFGNQAWVPAMTGTLTNIILVSLILWQLQQLMRNRSAISLGLLLAISLFMVHDFKTFTAYYTGCLLFVFALLLTINLRYSQNIRFAFYGVLAAIGLYAKPLILMSFLIALPLVLILIKQESKLKKIIFISRSLFVVVTFFIITIFPWQIYKFSIMSQYSDEYKIAHHAYSQSFFDNHGTGIAQLRDASDKIAYLKNNAIKNFRILRKNLSGENSFSIYLLFFISAFSIFQVIRKKYFLCKNHGSKETNLLSNEIIFTGILACVIIGNLFWYIVFSFAMTPGHAFFLTFFSFFLLFFTFATHIKSEVIAIAVSFAAVLFFQARLPQMAQAYQFKARNYLVSNNDIYKAIEFIEQNPAHFSLASCGWNAGPWRIEYLLPKSQNFVDCFNVLEDNLVLNEEDYIASNPGIDLLENGRKLAPREHFFTQGKHREVNAKFSWGGSPSFTFAIEGLSFLGAMQSKEYILSPMAKVCLAHMLFKEGNFIVCDVPFDEIKDKLDPTETARQLVDYQSWYRTRIKVY